MNDRLRLRAIRAVPWVAFEAFGLAIFGLASVFILARLLPPEDFGAAAVAITVVTFLETVVAGGLVEALVQRRSLTQLETDSVFWATSAFALVALGICAAIGPWLADLYGDPRLVRLLIVTGVSCVLAALAVLPTAMLMRDFAMKRLALRSLFGRLTAILVAVSMALTGFGVWSLVVSILVGNLVSLVVLWMSYRGRPAFQFSMASYRSLFGFGFFVALENLLWTTTTRAFIMLTGAFFGLTALGYLNFAFRIAETVSSVFGGAVARIGLPFFASLTGGSSDLGKAFERSTKLVLFPCAPAFVGIAVTAPDFVPLLFGEHWSPAVPLLQILSVVWVLSLSRSMAGPLLKALGRPAALIWPGAVAGLLALAGVAATSGTTIFVATVAWASRLAITIPLSFWILRREAGVAFATQIAATLWPVPAALLMAGILWTLRLLAPAQLGIPGLLAWISTGAASYLIVVLLVDRDLRQVLRKGSIVLRMVPSKDVSPE